MGDVVADENSECMSASFVLVCRFGLIKNTFHNLREMHFNQGYEG